jgi:hypothetical protein
MGLFDSAAGITSKIGAAQSTFGAISGGAGVVKNLSSALDLAKGGDILAGIRSINLPAAGELVGNVMAAVSLFSSDNNSDDWRVRLSLPSWPAFTSSPALAPLKAAGGLVFPYTPSINIESSAKYTPVSPVHSNFAFQTYENSKPGAITITAPFYVEDAKQALYWIAAVHYLRSVSKMFTGRDFIAGNPPPLVLLNGYGNYVFKNVPVVITKFTVSLKNDTDYISTGVEGSAAGAVTGLADSIGGLAGSIGGMAGALGGLGGAIGSIANTVGSLAAGKNGIADVSSLLGGFGIGGTVSGGTTYVPVKSEISVTVEPAYSRNSARNFSLQQFVQGGYMNGTPGYI